jgi:tetratricopeptide (TPR) repeat protein
MELRNPGHIDDAIRESEILLEQTSDPDERAGLLTGEHVCYCILGRLTEARRVLAEIQRLEISDAEVRLNAEFCEPCLLIAEGKVEEGVSAFSLMLQRNGELFREARFRYLYEDIQSRRAWALFGLSRCGEALPLLREVVSFSLEDVADEQRMHFALGVCLDETGESGPAKQEFFHTIGLNLNNDHEERARYRLARLLVGEYAFAQARKQLEMIVQNYESRAPTVSAKYVYQQLSHVCSHLGDAKAEKLYADLAKVADKESRSM